MNITNAIAVFVGGGLGSLARWLVGGLIDRISAGTSGYSGLISISGVLTANLCATLLLALLIYSQGTKLESDSVWMALIGVGFCGGFSTFSTFSIDTFRLFEQGNTFAGFLNIALSVLSCLAVAWAVYSVYAKS
ncbi:MAG: chromosome condensation protein CrcB [Crocinitomicaceae bacterium]|nr:chromosome condensation protein CrcB [Crocinitomicaceae bacterium]